MAGKNAAVPFPETYWVVPGLLLAGENPAVHYLEMQTRARLQSLIKSGIQLYIDLTESDRYSEILAEEGAQYMKEVRYLNFPIVDFEIPDVAYMVGILNHIDRSIEGGKPVYVHCFAGIGRTGTVVGCYLARHGKGGKSALEAIKNLRSDMPNAYRRSPESDAQLAFVNNWKVGQ